MRLLYKQVISTSGDSNLGGDDFDEAIVNWLVQQYNLGIDSNSNINSNSQLSRDNGSRGVADIPETTYKKEITFSESNDRIDELAVSVRAGDLSSGGVGGGGDNRANTVNSNERKQKSRKIGEVNTVKNPMKDPVARSRLFEAARKAKEMLSFQKSVVIDIPMLDAEGRGLSCELSRSKFETLTKPLLNRLLKVQVPCNYFSIMGSVLYSYERRLFIALSLSRSLSTSRTVYTISLGKRVILKM